MTKSEVYDKFTQWINQRPGLDPCNYGGYGWALESDYKRVAEQKKRATLALSRFDALPYNEKILQESMRAFSGRLQFNTTNDLVYCAGQYWPTEYRLAAAVVLETYVFDSCVSSRKACLAMLKELDFWNVRKWIKVARQASKELKKVAPSVYSEDMDKFLRMREVVFSAIEKQAGKNDVLASTIISLANHYKRMN